MAYKIENLINNVEKNKNNIAKIIDTSYVKNSSSFTKKITKISIDTTPVYYDLYKFLGVTYSVGEVSPTPESAYDARLISGTTYAYSFIYPAFGFAVPFEETPESVTDGATPWEFQTSIAIIKSTILFSNISDLIVDGMSLISYVSNEDGSVVEDLKVVLEEESQSIDEVSIDFSEFYRWIQLSEGYQFEYYAIYPVPENHQITLTSNLYFYNTKNDYYAQKIII